MIQLEILMKINQAIATINKQYGDNTIGFAKDLRYTNVERIPSGSLFLDWALGKNSQDGKVGWPLGRIVELYGSQSAGKSLISLLTISEAQKLGLGCAYIDCENTYDKGFAEALGVDNSKLLLSRESGGEKVLEMVCGLFKSEDLKVVVIDSLAAMIPTVEASKDLEQQQMAPMARLMSKGLRKLNAFNKYQALIIFINQLRENPGTIYGNPEYTPGGRSLKFYSSLRVEVRWGGWIFDVEEKKKKVGQVVKFKVVKNKTSIPYREGYFKFMYDGLIDQVDQLISMGLLNGSITRRGAYFDVGGERFQGRDNLEAEMKKDKKLFERAKEEVFK